MSADHDSHRDEVPEGFVRMEAGTSPTFVSHIGPIWIKREGDYPVIGVRAQQYHCNPFRELHGGFIAGLADFATAYTLMTGPEPTPTAVTLQLSTQMIASAGLGDWIEARGKLRRKGRSIAFVDVEFTCKGRIIAASDAVFRVLSDSGVAERFKRRSSEPSPPA